MYWRAQGVWGSHYRLLIWKSFLRSHILYMWRDKPNEALVGVGPFWDFSGFLWSTFWGFQIWLYFCSRMNRTGLMPILSREIRILRYWVNRVQSWLPLLCFVLSNIKKFYQKLLTDCRAFIGEAHFTLKWLLQLVIYHKYMELMVLAGVPYY